MEAEIERILEKYPPLKIQKENVLGRDGLTRETHVFINEKGARIIPNIRVGPEQHHRELFVWYERAFGRGRAGYLTHFAEGNPKARSLIGPRFAEDYYAIASKAAAPMAGGTKQRAEEVVEAIKEYVKKYPLLYRL